MIGDIISIIRGLHPPVMPLCR